MMSTKALNSRSAGIRGHWIALLVLCVALLLPAESVAEVDDAVIQGGKISLTLRNVDISEVMEMLSRAAHVNILLSKDVDGEISVNLYEVRIAEAIHSIAASAGYGVEYRKGKYFILKQDEVGKSSPGGPTRLRTFKVQYSDPSVVADILENHLSSYGQITAMPERKLLVVEDTPHFLSRIETLLKELDREPKLILIEAQILEVGLNDSESFGLDWTRIFASDDARIGTQGLATPNSPGLFFELLKPKLEIILDALRTRGRLRTLSTPKLLALEDREAETLIGDRLGYNVTTTIDNVTTTSTEFLESGVILRVKPSVDEQNRILLEVHPEVSTGSVSDDGIPNQTTTEVTTSMLVESGQTVFIGGLIKRSSEQTREGVPVLGDIPVLGMLFSNRAMRSVNTELIVLITPHIVDNKLVRLDAGKAEEVAGVAAVLEEPPREIEENLDQLDHFADVFDPDE